MQRKQTYYRDMNTTKRKKNRSFYDFNSYSKSEEYNILTQTDGLRRPIKYYKQNKISSYDGYYKIKAPKDSSPIDAYIQESKKNIYLYDTKHKCYYSGFNNAPAQDCHYNYSGTDVNRLLIFMEYTNDTMQRLLKDLKTSTLQDTPDLSMIILVIDSKKLKDFFNVDKYKAKKEFLVGDFDYQARDTTVLFSNVTQNSFDITIEQQCMGFRISVCKYSFRNLLDTLTAVCNLSRYSFPIYEFKTPSLWIGNWYIRNIIQGHILRILLSNVNVNTLNVMRNLYFVVITETTRNFNIQINFVLKNGAFTLYEDDPFYSISGPVNWNYEHRNILQTSTSIDTWNILNKSNEKRKTFKPLDAITYTKSASSDFPISKLHYEYENSSQTSDDTYALYSDIGLNLNKSDATINFTVNKGVGTSFIFSLDEISGQNKDLGKKCASTLCNFKIENIPDMTLLGYSKLWLTKLLHGSKLVGTCLNLHNKHDYINETMFDTSSVNLYVKYVNKYWKQFTFQTLYKDFFKCLAQSLIYTLFSYEIK